jgi:site-specific DNA recombinase
MARTDWDGAVVSEFLRTELFTGSTTVRKHKNDKVNPRQGKKVRVLTIEESERIPITVPQIISYATFVEANRMRKALRRAPNEARVYILSGILRCGDCGSMMNGLATPRKYYICQNRKRKKTVCSNGNVRADKIEERIKEIVRHWVNDPDEAIEEYIKSEEPKEEEDSSALARLEGERESLQKKLEAVHQSRANIRSLNLKGIYAQNEFEKDMKEVTEQEKKISADIKDIEEQIRNLSIWEEPQAVYGFFEMYKEYVNTLDNPAYWKKFLPALIKEIKLYPYIDGNGELSIIGIISANLNLAYADIYDENYQDHPADVYGDTSNETIVRNCFSHR